MEGLLSWGPTPSSFGKLPGMETCISATELTKEGKDEGEEEGKKEEEEGGGRRRGRRRGRMRGGEVGGEGHCQGRNPLLSQPQHGGGEMTRRPGATDHHHKSPQASAQLLG